MMTKSLAKKVGEQPRDSHDQPPLHSLSEPSLPSLGELGYDLIDVSSTRRLITLVLPFVAMGLYALFAWLHYWPLAIAAVAALSFITYGSTSHDLVHRALRLPRRLNDLILSVIELLSLRSGTAYRLSHQYHHAHLLEHDDVEAAAAHGTLFGALAAGPLMQVRLWRWAWRRYPESRAALLAEACGIVALLSAAAAAFPVSKAPLIYAGLVIAGSWVFPLVTVYLPHNARGSTPLTQTRRFSGWFARVIAFDHLYHLEHHLYPAVPHHHWRALAVRLEPYFDGQKDIGA